MSNDLFPLSTTIRIVNPILVTVQFTTIKGLKFDPLGTEQRKAKMEYPTRMLTVKYKAITPSEYHDLQQFHMKMKGSYDDFTFLWPASWASKDYEDEYVGVGDGSTTLFNLPCIATSEPTFTVDGVALTAPEFTWNSGAGVNGEDQIQFDIAAPIDGAVIATDFTGRLKIRGYFAEDELKGEIHSEQLVNLTVKIQGTLNS